jgi:hypothetical protein
LKHNDAGSIAANRFDLSGNVDFTMIRDQTIMLFYDAVQGHWHNLSDARNPFTDLILNADQLIMPTAPGYPVNGTAIATLARDSLNSAILVLQFDDTINEGTAFDVIVPNEALNINLDFIYRAETAPGVTKTVVPAFYFRAIPLNAVMPAWSAKRAFTNNLSVQTNAYYQYATLKENLLAHGIPKTGLLTQFEIIRDATSVTDDLVGDFNLKYLKIWFS